MINLEGAISVKAAILNKKRKVNKVYIDKSKKTKDFNFIRKITKTNNIELIELNRDELDKLATSKSYGGIIAEVEKRSNDEFIEGDIFYLDGIEDPFNIGYMIRTSYAFGIKNVILSRDINQEAQIIKSSAGAYEMANIKIINDDLSLVDELKGKGYTVYSLQRGDESKDIFNTKFSNKALFIIGGEKRGISASLEEKVDIKLYIPYGSDFRNSLSGASSSDVVATLLYRQRNYD